MTCLEKLTWDHPEFTQDTVNGIVRNHCPHDYGYLDESYWCNGRNENNCRMCWERTFGEDKPELIDLCLDCEQLKMDGKEKTCPHMDRKFTEKVIECVHRKEFLEGLNKLVDEINKEEETGEFTKYLYKRLSEELDVPVHILKHPSRMPYPTVTVESTIAKAEDAGGCITPTIKDSGARRQFATGAVTDSHDGKGRCDLMPLDVVADIRGQILRDIYDYQTSGDPKYLKIALQKFIDKYMKDVSTALLEVSIHFEEGAKKYGEYNWQKGIPTRCHIDSAVRHYLKFMRGDKDERHDRAFMWRLLCCIWTCIHKPELNDYSKSNRELDK